jgi:hypothetical protein
MRGSRQGWRLRACVGLGLIASAACAARAPSPVPEQSTEPTQPPLATVESAGEDSLRAENALLRADLEHARGELAALEERYAALLAEMDRELEEVLDSKASLRGVHNRALAISRIAEVRVQLGNVAESDDVEVRSRVARADELLRRADRALGEGNFGGASYLADRAGDFVRNARAVAEFQARRGATGTIAIVPPRALEVVTSANLREGPGTDRRRVAGAVAGSVLEAVARLASWYEVKLEGGGTAWIHRSTVR